MTSADATRAMNKRATTLKKVDAEKQGRERVCRIDDLTYISTVDQIKMIDKAGLIRTVLRQTVDTETTSAEWPSAARNSRPHSECQRTPRMCDLCEAS